MPMLLIALLFLTTATAVFCLGAAHWAPTSVVGVRLRSLAGTREARPRKQRLDERFHEKVLEPLAEIAPKSPSEVSRTRQWLMMAGYREPRHVRYYFGLRVLLAVVLLLLAIASGWAFEQPIVLLALLAFAYVLPRFVLKRLIRRRQRSIRLALPDALDLAVICVEAGLGLDQAIQRVSVDLKYAHPHLSDELNLANLEIRAGKPRAEALRNLATRTGVDDVRSLVAVLVQTDRFGTSVGQALRVHSDALRTERRQRAEEQAAKTTIKMVPVLVFFVFPSMFIVSLGPAFIQLLRNLLPAIQR